MLPAAVTNRLPDGPGLSTEPNMSGVDPSEQSGAWPVQVTEVRWAAHDSGRRREFRHQLAGFQQ